MGGKDHYLVIPALVSQVNSAAAPHMLASLFMLAIGAMMSANLVRLACVDVTRVVTVSTSLSSVQIQACAIEA